MAIKRTILMLVIILIILGMGVWILPKNTILASAAQEGNLGTVNLMLTLGAKPNTNSGNLTPLNYAVRQGHVDVVKRLLQAGANPNLKGSIGDVTSRAFFTPLEDVINYQPQNMEMLELLLQAGANPNDYFTLDHAVENENVEAIKLLLNAGADKAQIIQFAEFYRKPQIVALCNGHVNPVAPSNQTQVVNQSQPAEKELKYSAQLITAAETGDLKKVMQLIKEGYDPNSQDKNSGITPLTQAALFGHVDVVKYLLQHGANPNQKDEYNGTALDAAIHNEPTLKKNEKQITELVNDLIKAGADVNNVSGGPEATLTTPLLDATVNSNSGVVATLLNAGAKPDVLNENKQTPLWYGAYIGNVEIVQLLLDAGANGNLADVNGRKPIDIAREKQNIEVFKLLSTGGKALNPGTNQEIKSKDELNSDLLSATKKGDAEGVRRALDMGADPNYVYDNSTILFIAVESNQPDIVKLLLDAGADYTYGTQQATPLFVAELNNNQQIVKLLRDAGATD
ncbi:hypothetical protein C7R94_15915 [Brevibacillus sp. NRRL NRS-603]|nr:hypothetical protein C7R94_15915 [Brevibacillus sp. NRRL NRS-603]